MVINPPTTDKLQHRHLPFIEPGFSPRLILFSLDVGVVAVVDELAVLGLLNHEGDRLSSTTLALQHDAAITLVLRIKEGEMNDPADRSSDGRWATARRDSTFIITTLTRVMQKDRGDVVRRQTALQSLNRLCNLGLVFI